jgi:hypothetical protein
VTEREISEARQRRLKELTTQIWDAIGDYERTSGAKVNWVEYFEAGLVIHHEPKDGTGTTPSSRPGDSSN